MNLLELDPATDSTAFGRHAGHSEGVTLGIRAEDLTLGTAGASDWSITGIVGLVEPTGKDRVVQLVTDAGQVVAFRCEVAESPAPGSRVTVVGHPRAVQVYSTATGRRTGTAVTESITTSALVDA